MKKNKNINVGVGRPKAVINVPSKKFTFADLVAENSHVTPLTLRKFIKRDMFTSTGKHNHKSTLVLVEGDKREPNSTLGLGRKTLVYAKRNRVNTLKDVTKSKVSVNVGTDTTVDPVVDHEVSKAALFVPTVTDPVAA